MSLPLFCSWMMAFWAGFYTKQAYIQDRLMCSSCAIIRSIHSAEHAYRNSTFVCSIHDFSYNKLNKNLLLQAAATIRERHMCRHAVAKVQILFESDLYSRAAFVQGRLIYKTLRYLFSSCFRATSSP